MDLIWNFQSLEHLSKFKVETLHDCFTDLFTMAPCQVRNAVINVFLVLQQLAIYCLCLASWNAKVRQVTYDTCKQLSINKVLGQLESEHTTAGTRIGVVTVFCVCARQN